MVVDDENQRMKSAEMYYILDTPEVCIQNQHYLRFFGEGKLQILPCSQGIRGKVDSLLIVKELFVDLFLLACLHPLEIQLKVSDVAQPLLTETVQKGYKRIQFLVGHKFGSEEGAETGIGPVQAISVEDDVHYYIVRFMKCSEHCSNERTIIVYNMEGRKQGNNRGYYCKQLAALRNEEVVFPRGRKGIQKANKLSCRQSREKKKVYLQSLEVLVKQQKQEIEQLKVQLLEQRSARSRENIFGQLLQEYRDLIVSIGERNERDVRSHLTILRARFGVDGRDRRKWMEEHLHRIAELSIPMHFRVLLQNCEDSKRFYQLLGGGQALRPFRNGFSEEQKEILRAMRPKIRSLRAGYDRAFQKMQSFWEQLQQFNRSSQSVIDEIEEKVNHPFFIASLLTGLDSQRNDPEIKQIYPLGYWKNLANSLSSTAPHLQQPADSEDEMAFDFFFNDSKDIQ